MNRKIEPHHIVLSILLVLSFSGKIYLDNVRDDKNANIKVGTECWFGDDYEPKKPIRVNVVLSKYRSHRGVYVEGMSNDNKIRTYVEYFNCKL